jgi:hypothetical protein
VRISTVEKPEKQPQTSDRWISQTTWNFDTKFWADDEHHREDTPQKFRPLTPYNSKNRKSHASSSRTRRTPKPPKLKAFLRDLKGKITKKESHQPHVWFQNQVLQRNTSKTFPRESQEKAPKITEKEKREEQLEHLRNHTEPSTLTVKDSDKV